MQTRAGTIEQAYTDSMIVSASDKGKSMIYFKKHGDRMQHSRGCLWSGMWERFSQVFHECQESGGQV